MYYLSEQIESFEKNLEQNMSVTRISNLNISALDKVLSCEDSEDSYATSAAYYLFTGRRGLWAYQKHGTSILFCWHPNIDGQILVFPPIGRKDFGLFPHFLSNLPHAPNGIHFVRHQFSDVVALNKISRTAQAKICTPIQETVLDWRYPAHILSSDELSKLKGHQYMLIRNRIRQINKHSVRVELLSREYICHVESLISRWARLHTTNQPTVVDLMNPYLEILSMYRKGNGNLKGLVFFVDEQAEGVTIWDVSNRSNKTANIYVNLCNTNYKGLSELALVSVAQRVSQEGVHFLNLGGSETESLDRYKKKFAPTHSVDLHTLQAITFNDEQTTHQRKLAKAI
jgi:hypothetical protein